MWQGRIPQGNGILDEFLMMLMCPEGKRAFRVMELALCVPWLLEIVDLNKTVKQIGEELREDGAGRAGGTWKLTKPGQWAILKKALSCR